MYILIAIVIVILIAMCVIMWDTDKTNEHMNEFDYGNFNYVVESNRKIKNYLNNIPITVINLEHRPERLGMFMKEIEKINIDESNENLHIIKAINGDYLNLKQLKNTGILQPTTRELRAGEIGCYFSHLLCWKKIMQTKYPYGIVVEDDVIPENDFEIKFNHIMDQALEFEWDILLLGKRCIDTHYGDNCMKGINVNKNLWYPKIPGYGTHSYIIKRSGIIKLSKLVYPINVPIDVLLINLVGENKIKILSVKNDLFKQRNTTDSDTIRINKTQ